MSPETVADMIREAYEEGWHDGQRSMDGFDASNGAYFDRDWEQSMTRIEHDKLTNMAEGY